LSLFSIQKYEEQYQKTGNPVLAWRAYLECRAMKLPFPEWVLKYLDRPATLFWEWSMKGGQEVPKDLGGAVVQALEMRRPGRAGGASWLIVGKATSVIALP